MRTDPLRVQAKEQGRPAKSASCCRGDSSLQRPVRPNWRRKKSLLIVAANELDKEELSDKELLKGYKGQHSVE